MTESAIRGYNGESREHDTVHKGGNAILVGVDGEFGERDARLKRRACTRGVEGNTPN